VISRVKAATLVVADDRHREYLVWSDNFGHKRIERAVDHGRDVLGGTRVVCEEKKLVWEEAGEACKDVWDVGGDLRNRFCADIGGWCSG